MNIYTVTFCGGNYGSCLQAYALQTCLKELGSNVFVLSVNQPQTKNAYVAASNDKELTHKSSSGGIFTILAHKIIEKGGIVYGAAMMCENEILYASISVSTISSNLHYCKAANMFRAQLTVFTPRLSRICKMEDLFYSLEHHAKLLPSKALLEITPYS